jgi:ribosomal protein S18 acetylase RimI-like enzyme
LIDKKTNKIDLKQVEAAAVTLAKAFYNDPVFEYLFPDTSTREEKSTKFYKMFVNYTVRYGEVYSTSDFEGVAGWLPPEKMDMSTWGLIRSGVIPLLPILGMKCISRMFHFDKHSLAVHKRNTPFPHIVLQPLGVSPSVQGKGYASLLLRTKFEQLDEQGLPCYVDTQTEKNASMYEHYGFKVVEQFRIPDTQFDNWVMIRQPEK